MELSNFAIDVPAELIAQIAVGLEEPKDLALRAGITEAQWAVLEQWQPFLDEVAKRRAELEASGVSFRTKSKLKAEILSDKIFVRAMADNAPFGTSLSALEHFVKVADLNPNPNPKVAATAGSGTGFSITINLPGEKKAPGITFDHMPKETLPIYMREQSVEVIDVKSDD